MDVHERHVWRRRSSRTKSRCNHRPERTRSSVSRSTAQRTMRLRSVLLLRVRARSVGNCPVGLSCAKCGVGIRERSVICRQSDGRSVAVECCILKKCPSRSDSLNLIDVDYRALDVHSQDVCGIACPGDCVLAPWSNWGPCSLDCSRRSGRGMQSRSRGIIVTVSHGGLCLDQTSRIETEQCSTDVHCFLYAWVTTLWANGVRNVSCVRTALGGGGAVAVVDSGCVEVLRPAAQQSCVLDSCDGNATCSNTMGSFDCTCNAGFTGNGQNCDAIDECADGTDDCDEHADCMNVLGSFSCVCRKGFSGDGRSCLGKQIKYICLN